MQHEIKENKLQDEKRDKYLENLGIRVLRYSNADINKNFNIVCDDILKYLGINADDIKRRGYTSSTAIAVPLPQGEGFKRKK